MDTVTSLFLNVKQEFSHLPSQLRVQMIYLQLSFTELLKKCKENFLSITVTQQQAKHLEEATRTQADSKTWF